MGHVEPVSMLTVFVLAGLLLAWALLSARMERWNITAPIVFVFAGMLLASDHLHAVEIAVKGDDLRQLAEVTLALVLFSDAARVRLRELRARAAVPVRLLAIGLPLTLLLGVGAAVLLFPDLDPWAAAVIAAACAPTDAALGSAVVDDPDVPPDLRRSLSVESGLNDGIATPFVMLFLAGATAEGGASTHAEGSAVVELILGAGIGVALGALAGLLLARARRAGWAASAYAELAVPGAALACYAGAAGLGGNGFVAAFAGGLAFGSATRRRGDAPALDFDTSLGVLLSLLVWFIFGSALLVALGSVTVQAVVFAVLALTVLRILPVAVALAGAHLDRATVLFMGWFGPRGLASVVFALLAYEDLEGPPADTVLSVIALTVAMSVLAHGVTARPGIRRYVRRSAAVRSPADEQGHAR
jgi:NhaP-type Na+/H+ or K+/H+ antiporter